MARLTDLLVAGGQSRSASRAPVAITGEAGIVIDGVAAEATHLGDKIIRNGTKRAVAAKEIANKHGPTGPVLHKTPETSAVGVGNPFLYAKTSRTSGPTSS